MLKHYIKFALRNFRSNKVIFAGSLVTLCLGALCISLLFSYVHNELTMNNFHKNNIYTVIIRDSPSSDWSGMNPSYFFDFDYSDFPEVEEAISVKKINKNEATIFYKNSNFVSEGIITDVNFFKIFDFKLKGGDGEKLTNDSNTVLLSEQFVKNVFGGQNPLGKPIKISTNKEEKIYTVKGVVNLPVNSSLTFDFILFRSKKIHEKGVFLGTDFISVKKTTDINIFKRKIKNIGKGQPLFEFKDITIVALDDVYLEKDIPFKADVFPRYGDKKNIYVLIVIMFVILIISALNFSNLQIVNMHSSVKKNAIYMVNGAQKRHVFFKKNIELLLLLLLSISVITLGYQYLIPAFNNFTNVELAPPLWKVVLINGVVLFLILFLALIYPLIIIIRTSIIKSLKKVSFIENRLIGQKLIIIFQFTLTMLLLVSSLVVTNQLRLMLNKDLGFTSENIIRSKMYFESFHNPDEHRNNKTKIEQEKKTKYQYIKNELSSNPKIIKFSQGSPLLNPNAIEFKIKETENDFTTLNFYTVTPGFEKIYDIEVVEGRFFDIEKDNPMVKNKKVVINEAAKRFWNLRDISKHRVLTYGLLKNGYEIIGVVKDFNYERLSVKPKPLIMFYNEFMENDFHIQFQKDKEKEGLQFVEDVFKKVNPRETFQYSFLSDEIELLYKKEKRLSIIYIIFTAIALLISGIGLFTVALYDTQRRIKEVGVRKVNGATINEIMFMLNKDFIKWVVVAFVIACPIAYYAMSKWLENFAYKTELSWWVFALAGVFTLVIALLTVSWQTYKAATRNPVESLRDE
ncbi:ABC transporter permease [Flavivirga aquimarina]|uniref:ABC transporter permease n=1 Tax=Flavivirga aquimarina TaxID=2027862 RepID=A0ABT8WCF9_9FLAO|nr:ABC transporter permease [Flavivirga aquimarina]MDO5970832.1 ABC transporter permease [Flavivirga aquimarina]